MVLKSISPDWGTGISEDILFVLDVFFSLHQTLFRALYITDTSAGRSLGFSVSMFVSDICNRTSNISDYGVEV